VNFLVTIKRTVCVVSESNDEYKSLPAAIASMPLHGWDAASPGSGIPLKKKPLTASVAEGVIFYLIRA
jgi:hypothetical protein